MVAIIVGKRCQHCGGALFKDYPDENLRCLMCYRLAEDIVPDFIKQEIKGHLKPYRKKR